MKKAVVLINLGTPADLTRKAVGEYLKEFLLDPFVIDIPWLFRQILVRGIIAPFRAKKSLHAYIQIWTKEGSPLMINTVNLATKLNSHIEEDTFYCMRYGQPNIKQCVKELMNYDSVLVVPLYPQYALSSTETALVEFKRQVKKQKLKAKVNYVQNFYNHPDYIGPLTEKIKNESTGFDYVLFSYHGLPKRHLTKLDSTGQCTVGDCCAHPGDKIKKCYRAQCYATTNAVTSKLENLKDKSSTSFQSRLSGGWIEPFTDFELPKLAKKGIKKIAVVCPSFVADCLETLEEIQLRAKEEFIQAGGEDLKLIPCLNADESWVEGLAKIIQDHSVC